MKVAVLGAGAFGTSLAIQLARRGAPTLLWGRDVDAMDAMQAGRENLRYLAGYRLPDSIEASANLADIVDVADHFLIATPTAALRDVCQRLLPQVRLDQGIACACKGLEPGTGRLVHEVIVEIFGERRPLAMISGPTFARELAAGLPTAVTVASPDAGFAEGIAAALHGGSFRAYTSTDIIGVEIGGAVKNVLAIAVGTADGLGLGANTRAAMITRGLNEITRLAAAMGARADTIMGLSGLGDLVLTCTDDQSRNRRLGLLLGRGHTVAEACALVGGVVEGLRAAPEVLRRAAALGVEMPLTQQIVDVIAGRTAPAEAVRRLSERPPRAEADAD